MNPIDDLRSHCECPIAMEMMVEPSTVLPCGHSFEGHSINKWMKSNATCPLDRGKIESVTYNSDLKELISRVHRISAEDAINLEEINQLKERIIQTRHQEAVKFREERFKKQQKIEESFSKQIDIGLYLLAKCKNKACEQLNQRVWINKGIGNFSVTKECYSTNCRFCEKEIEDINTVAIRGMNYVWEGQRVTGEKKIEKENSQSLKYCIFFNLFEWRYLSVNITI